MTSVRLAATLAAALGASLVSEMRAACPDATWLAYPAEGPPGTPETCVKGFDLSEGEKGIFACAEQCRSQNASLPCVWGPVQNKFLLDSFNKQVFIGLYQDDTNDPTEGWQAWANGCSSPYRNWHWKEPDNTDGVREDCAVVGDDGVDKWHAYPCDRKFLCVCETPGTSTQAFLTSEHLRIIRNVSEAASGNEAASGTSDKVDYEGKYNELRSITIALAVAVVVLTIALAVTTVRLCRRRRSTSGSQLENYGLKSADPAPASVVGASLDSQ